MIQPPTRFGNVRRGWMTLIVMAALLSNSAPAAAQGTGRSLDIDLSIRSSGMGGASNAVFWGGDPNYWANPALLGLHRGTAFTWGKTQLVPGLASDVFLESRRYAFAYAGVGIATAGPGPGDIRLDYGDSEGTDPNGNSTGVFNSYEHVESWSIGWSLSSTIETWAAFSGRRVPAIARYADIGVGFSSKDIDINLDATNLAGQASGTGKDHGLFVRVSPFVVHPQAAWPVGVDLAYGNSVLNYNDERIVFINAAQASPLTRMERSGLAGHFTLGVPASARAGASPAKNWLLDSLEPLISFGVARDWEHNSAGGIGSFYDVDRNGVEIVFANVLTWRTGHVTDRVGHIDGDTSGWGLGFHVGHAAGLRYDHATIPQAEDSGLPDVDRNGFMLFIDLVTLLDRGGPGTY